MYKIYETYLSLITFSGETDQDGDLSSHSKSLKSLERQIFMETLRYEQERLQLVRHIRQTNSY